MRRLRILLLTLSALLFSSSVKAQVSGNLVDLTLSVPQIDQIYVSQLDLQHIRSSAVLFSATLQSLSSTPLQVRLKLTIDVTLASGNSYPGIAYLVTKPFPLEPGQVKVITSVDLSGESPSIGVDESQYNGAQVQELKNVALATGKAPAGIYTIELQCLDQNHVPISQPASGSIVVTNPSRIELALPMDQGNVSTLFPHFQWMSNVDTVVLSVYEQLPSQQSPEDVVSGVPYLRVTVPNTSSPAPGSLNYPPSGAGVRPLQNGRTYYWYVKVPSSSLGGGGIRSDIWSFTVGGSDSTAFGQGGGNMNDAATEALKNLLSGTNYQKLTSEIQMLTGQATYDGSPISTSELIDTLRSMDKSKISSVTIQ